MPTRLYRWSYTGCSQFERPMLSPLVLLLYHLIVSLLYRLIFVNLWLWRNLLHAITISRMNTMTAFLWTFPTVTHYLTMSSFVCDQRMQAKSFNSTHTTNCPQKYKAAWHTLLQQHIAAGRLRASNSEHSSPAFIIPKADPTVLPRWVNDYCILNSNTIPDNHPLPQIDEILHDCTKGQFFGKIDMTNSFFQTKVHPNDIHWLAVHTPWGLYEWTVMPMGVHNAPAVHQRHMHQQITDLGTGSHRLTLNYSILQQ